MTYIYKILTGSNITLSYNDTNSKEKTLAEKINIKHKFYVKSASLQ